MGKNSMFRTVTLASQLKRHHPGALMLHHEACPVVAGKEQVHVTSANAYAWGWKIHKCLKAGSPQVTP